MLRKRLDKLRSEVIADRKAEPVRRRDEARGFDSLNSSLIWSTPFVNDKASIGMTSNSEVNENALPFDPKPNSLTVDTMRKSARGEDLHYAKDADGLFEDLGIASSAR